MIVSTRPTGTAAPLLPRPAVFIDRDGTLNVHNGYVREPSQLEVYDSAGPAVRRLNDAGWLTVLVTNQAIIGRGQCSTETMERIHEKLNRTLALAGAHLDAIYVCPHRPPAELAVIGSEKPCGCRKPLPGLLLAAARDLNIDLRRSWMVGDSVSDIEAGIAAGTATILLETGTSGSDRAAIGKADHAAIDFAAATRLILSPPARGRSSADH